MKYQPQKWSGVIRGQLSVSIMVPTSVAFLAKVQSPDAWETADVLLSRWQEALTVREREVMIASPERQEHQVVENRQKTRVVPKVHWLKASNITKFEKR